MGFIADLHIHSKYSRATSKKCDVENLAWWARRKGIAVVGTGDFTHPAWREELREQLVPAEPGLFRLRDDLQAKIDRVLPRSCDGPVRFTLSVEISSIYKRHDRVRKVHNLIYAPGFEHADRIVEKLERIGNLRSDGRPILGLDSHDLLEIVLEVGGGCYLVPAHIWTPWFSLFGAKSGFDAVEECFGDLSDHVFALETGLSSDPEMIWRLSQLDRFRLVSNSDAHSPAKLGREANLFDCALDYFAIKRSLESGVGFAGTVEFYPEEGKYHLDGHRKCGVRLTPAETEAAGGRCPACGRLVTVGVASRVAALADRSEGFVPKHRDPFYSLIPMHEVIGEAVGAGAGTKKVASVYDRLVDRIGPELYLLREAPLVDIERHAGDLLAEGIARMRGGRVICEAGYDGEYGVIKLFSDEELRAARGTGVLFAPEPAAAETTTAPMASPESQREAQIAPVSRPAATGELDEEQGDAASVFDGPLLIIAGPGTGKTRTLTHRIAKLVSERGAAPGACLAITFTRRAAEEMRERLEQLLPASGRRVPVTTFHGLGLQILREFGGLVGLPPELSVVLPPERVALLAEALGITQRQARHRLEEISALRTSGVGDGDPELRADAKVYRAALRARGGVDFDDLILESVRLLESHPGVANHFREKYRWISIDEYQDIDASQYRLVRLIAPASNNVCAIGDPDQAIYGFRGADVGFFMRFTDDFAGARVVRLSRNYRSAPAIVGAALQVVAPSTLVKGRRLDALLNDPSRVLIHRAPTERAEAEFVAHGIEQLIGGYGFFSVDSGRVASGDAGAYGFSDIAILYRSGAQLTALGEALTRAGIPYQSRGHARLVERPGVARLMAAVDGHSSGGVVSELLAALASTLGADEPSGEIATALALLTPIARRFGDDRLGFLSEVALETDVDTWDPRADRVSLFTLHSAKGLEFDVVYIVGCEDGILPLRRPHEPCDVDEERRLFFVGMTRAKRRLVLTQALERRVRGSVGPSSPSPFLTEIEEDLLERSTRVDSRPRAAGAGRQLSLL